MADVKVENRTSEERSASAERRGGMARRGDITPTHDFFTLNPFSLMRRLSEEMDRAFTTSFGLGPAARESGIWSPAVEVTERDNNLVICAELPGLNKDDVRVEVTDDGLVIQGERKREHEETRGGYYRSERSYGRFYRTVPLPEGADPGKAQAQFKDGVLEVRVPLPESAKRKAREIPIKS